MFILEKMFWKLHWFLFFYQSTLVMHYEILIKKAIVRSILWVFQVSKVLRILENWWIIVKIRHEESTIYHFFRCYWWPGYCAFSMSRQEDELFWKYDMVAHNSPGITLSKVGTIWFPSRDLAFWHSSALECSMAQWNVGALEHTMAQWNFCLSANKSTNDSTAWQWWLLFGIVIGWNIWIMTRFSSCCPKPGSQKETKLSWL